LYEYLKLYEIYTQFNQFIPFIITW